MPGSLGVDLRGHPHRRWQRELSHVCDTYGRRLFRLAYNVVRDRDTAEDICQQALLKACEQRVRVDQPGRLRAWLCRVVINESLTWLRHQKVERRHRDAVARRDAVSGNRVDAAETRDQVLLALGDLPEKLRVVVLLRAMQGMSGQEVAGLLGCSESEVSRRLYRGLDLMRARLSPHVDTLNWVRE